MLEKYMWPPGLVLRWRSEKLRGTRTADVEPDVTEAEAETQTTTTVGQVEPKVSIVCSSRPPVPDRGLDERTTAVAAAGNWGKSSRLAGNAIYRACWTTSIISW